MLNDIDLLHEIGQLAKLKRSGFDYLGGVNQSLAEHSFRTACIAHLLASKLTVPPDLNKILLMALYHDLHEARSGDLNTLNKRYVHFDEEAYARDLAKDYKQGFSLVALINEYKSQETVEAKIVKDADFIELMLVLKERQEAGCRNALLWHERLQSKLTFDFSKELAEEILTTDSSRWWMQKQGG